MSNVVFRTYIVEIIVYALNNENKNCKQEVHVEKHLYMGNIQTLFKALYQLDARYIRVSEFQTCPYAWIQDIRVSEFQTALYFLSRYRGVRISDTHIFCVQI